MVRFEIEEGKITIAYGEDHLTGYFLSVGDARLWDSADATDEANSVALETTHGAGYFELHTAQTGFGKRVKLETLLYFWERYGVPDVHIQQARRGENMEGNEGTKTPDESRGPPSGKKKKRKKKKKQGAKSTNVEAGAIGTSSRGYPMKVVKGYLLPVDEDNPRLIDIKCEICPPEDGERGFDSCSGDAKNYLGDSLDTIHAAVDDAGKWSIGGPGTHIMFLMRDRFLFDGSPLNRCVRHITNGRARHRWSGPMLLMQMTNMRDGRLIDVDDETLRVGTEYLAWYASKVSIAIF